MLSKFSPRHPQWSRHCEDPDLRALSLGGLALFDKEI